MIQRFIHFGRLVLRYRNLLGLTALLLPAAIAVTAQPRHARRQVDLVVYGGTASGVMTAYSGAKEGLRVQLIEPGIHLGGMVTGGLSATDLGDFHIIGGNTRRFYLQAAAHYGTHDLDRPDSWRSEPHVDEAIFRRWLKEAGVEVVCVNASGSIAEWRSGITASFP